MLSKIIKLIGYILTVLLLLGLIAFITLKSVGDERKKNWVVYAVEKATGRDFAMDTFSLDIGSSLSLSAKDVRLDNAPWGRAPDMLALGELDLDLYLPSLLRGALDIRAVARDAEIWLETGPDALSNWAFSDEDTPPESSSGGLPLRPLIRELRLENARLVIAEAASERVLTIEQFLIETPQTDSTVNLVADYIGKPIKLAGELGNLDAVFTTQSNPLKLQGSLEDTQIEISGDWGPMLPKANYDISLNIEGDSAAQLASFGGVSIPELGGFKLASQFTAVNGQMAVKQLTTNLDGEDISAAVDGSITDLAAMHGLDANIKFNLNSTAALSQYIGQDVPDLGPVEATGRIISNQGVLSIEALKATAGTQGVSAQLDASIADLVALKGLNGDLKASISSLSALSKLSQSTLPNTPPIEIEASFITDKALANAPTAVALKAQSGEINAVLNTVLADIKDLGQLQAQLQVTAPSLAEFGAFAQRELPAQGPVKLSGNIDVKPQVFALNNLKLNIGEQLLDGQFSFESPKQAGGTSRLRASLNTPFVDLSPFLPGAGKTDDPEPSAAEEETASAKTEKPSDDARLFPDDPLALSLGSMDAEIAINAGRIKIGDAEITDFALPVQIKQGILTVGPLAGAGGEGSLGGQVVLNAQSAAATLDVDLNFANMPMPVLGGGLDLNAKLDGAGKSVAQIMAGLNGELIVVARDGTIKRSLATNIGSGLIPFSEDKKTVTLQCAILRTDVVNGVADFEKKLAIQTEDVIWRGGGEINLATEEIGLGVKPIPRKGIGLTTGTLASLIYVDGTLLQPSLQLNPKDVAVKYGKYMAFLSTGGLSLVAEALVNKVESKEDVCAKILDGTVFDDTAVETKAEAETQTVTESETETSAIYADALPDDVTAEAGPQSLEAEPQEEAQPQGSK